jgi:hypothetical protein
MIRFGGRPIRGFGLGAINGPDIAGMSAMTALAGAGAGIGAALLARRLGARPWEIVTGGVGTAIGVWALVQSKKNPAYEELQRAAVETGTTLPPLPPPPPVRSLTPRGSQVISTPGGFVSLVQQSLTNAGFDTIGIDNDWGTNTSAAASAYQTAHGMTPTGLPEPELLRALGVAIPSYPDSAAIAAALAGLSDVAEPRDALKIMLGESGMNPGPKSVAYHDGKPVAGGVFGLLVTQMPAGMSFDDWLALSAAQQIPYAAKFWRGVASQFSLPLPLTARNLYWANYLPATVVPGASDDYVFVKSDDTYLMADGTWKHAAGYYTQNESLDHPLVPGGPRKGYITAGDMALAAARGAMSNASTYASIADAISPQAVA